MNVDCFKNFYPSLGLVYLLQATSLLVLPASLEVKNLKDLLDLFIF